MEIRDIDARNDEVVEQPHNKLSTPLGRLLDKVAYWQVALAAICTISVSTIYFWATSGSCDGLAKGAGSSWGEALYFSVVTFSTVGYGDLTPVGWGRLVSSVEVLIGIILTSLVIGKVASERQAALLLLIYTSDQQRRIAAFADELREFGGSLQHSPAPTLSSAKSAATLIRSLRAYLVFQSHQGRLADFGNGSALRNLYRAMLEMQTEIELTLRERVTILDPKVEEELLKIADRVASLAEVMTRFHTKERSSVATFTAIAKKTAEIQAWEATSVTFRRMEQVRLVVPKRPWPKHFHKAAADRVGISRNLFRLCMNELIKLKRI